MSKKKIVLLSEIESLERLLYRLPENHAQRKFLEAALYRKSAGERGEERLRRKFIEFDLAESYHFLRNISLSSGQRRVQIDGLLLTSRGAIIIESKNISGQLQFNEQTGEFSRIDAEGVRTLMEDPTVQLTKHIRFLTNFFELHEIRLPITGLVVFTSKQCEFLSKPRNHAVCKTYQMNDYLFKLLQNFPKKENCQNLLHIDRLLQIHQSPYKRHPLCQQYSIDPDDLITGILCAFCRKHSMKRKHKSGWICAACSGSYKEAHHSAIQEYFSLINHQISNRQLRKFCDLASPYLASRLLAEFDFEVSGALKNRTYELKK